MKQEKRESPDEVNAGFDAEAFGHSLRLLRQRQELSIRDLATKAGVDKSTVSRVEQGKPSRFSVREKLCRALGTWPDWLEATASEVGPCYSIHRRSAEEWVLVGGEKRFGRHRAKEPSFADGKERSRLGSLGFAQRFYARLFCNPPDRSLSAGVMELFHEDNPPSAHEGTEFVYCQRGAIKVSFPDCFFVLAEGEAATFDARVPHTYSPAEPLQNPKEPPLLLYVMLGH